MACASGSSRAEIRMASHRDFNVCASGGILLIFNGVLARHTMSRLPEYLKRPFGGNDGSIFFSRVVLVVLGLAWLSSGLQNLV